MRISDWSSDVCSSDLGGGGGAGGGGGSAPPKLNVSVPSSECERKRVETSRPVWSTRSRLSALKKRYFRPTSMLSLSGARTPAIACQAKPVSESSRNGPAKTGSTETRRTEERRGGKGGVKR